jgi:hypothetical protein
MKDREAEREDEGKRGRGGNEERGGGRMTNRKWGE